MIIFYNLSNKFFLQNSKTDQFRKGNYVHIASLARPTCPVKLIRAYILDLRIPNGYPVFPKFTSKGRTNPSTVSAVGMTLDHSYNELRRALCKSAIPGTYTWHSFRSGGISKAINSGATVNEAMRHGRWRSVSSFDRYVCHDSEHLYSFSKFIAK